MRLLILCLFICSQAFSANLSQVLESRGNFKIFLQLIEAAELNDIIQHTPRLTIFAPTDEAFADLDQSRVEILGSDKELLRQTLLFHMANPVLTKKILKVLNGVKTLSGKYITKFQKDSEYTLESASILEFDIYASNGVAHALDEVLFFPEVQAANEIRPVDYVDLDRYQGLWYEIYRYPNSFERGCGSVTAEYNLKTNGSLKVVNTCVSENGSVKKANGTAFVVDQESNASLKVSFVPFFQRFGLFAGDYNVLYLDSEYEFVMVGSKDRNYLWFLARKPYLSEEDATLLRMQAISQGYDPSKLIKTPKY
ncbi:MAG: hypothetical protein CME65_06050 [Halobacteriovoraceae bacterium]|nr:hypothetical protein [Halobacteriovoraceae bacterium]|tara:strand:+ start:3307 stop:4236 length:930 start_codon:yes stop_codon:yes gene_type:complete